MSSWDSSGASLAKMQAGPNKIILVNDCGNIVHYAERHLRSNRKRCRLKVTRDHQPSHNPRSIWVVHPECSSEGGSARLDVIDLAEELVDIRAGL